MSEELKGHLAMLLFSACVAGSFSLGSMVANDIAPLALNTVRFIMAATIVGLLTWSTGGITRQALQAPWRYLLMGAVFSSYFVLMFEGLKTAAPVSAASVFTLNPVMSAGLGFVLLGQALTWRVSSALLIGAVGALWVIFRADFNAFMQFHVGRGEAIYFLGCVAHAFIPIMFRAFNRGEGAFMSTFGMLSGGTVVLTFVGWNALMTTDWMNLSPLVWWTILYVAIFASTITFVLLQFASMRLPAAKVMAYTYLTPIWVIVWEIALGKGVPTGLILGGVGLSVLAVIMLLKSDEVAA